MHTSKRPRTRQAEVAAVVMQPGLANVCLLTSVMTIVRQRIDVRAWACRNGHGRTHLT